MSENDRNFDDLAQRFSKKVYGGLKGDIRLAVLWQDIQQQLPILEKNNNEKALRILDVGGGLGQIAIRLAALGHEVVVNDISAVMLDEAKKSATEAGVEKQMQWQVGAYQDLDTQVHGLFDVVLCHAVLEWVEKPEQLIQALSHFCKPQGLLSLCFYNPASKEYRNLIKGNFKLLNQECDYQSNTGSLTPNNPSSPNDVKGYLSANGFMLEDRNISGLRVFHDYVVDKRGGHENPEDVLAMEVKYSRHETFKWMGRYLHFLAQKT